MTNTSGKPTFSAHTVSTVLRDACASVGLNGDYARLLHLGDNALHRLDGAPIVVRIAPTTDHWDDAVKAVAVADWLAAHDFPAARAAAIEQPLEVHGHPVTFWRYLDGRNGTRRDIAQLGSLLRRLHATPPPTTFTLPAEDILGRIQPHIESAPVPTIDKDLLLERCDQLRQELPRLDFPLRPGPTHGNAHVRNLMVTANTTMLIDFDRFAWGQPEWDLAVTATEFRTAGWWREQEYDSLVNHYGYDIITWPGFPILRAAQEIRMTSWVMRNVRESAKVAAEYAVRMKTIRTGEPTGDWTPSRSLIHWSAIT